MSKTIFITGASRGFGKLWAEAFLQRGDKVAATSRNIGGLQDLADKYGDNFLPIALDITDRAASIAAVNQAHKYFNSLDVVINNAGYGVFGAVEEATEKETKDVFDANVFGTLWITQAAWPIFREQRHGHIIQLSSVLGVWSLPTLGIYNATSVNQLAESLFVSPRYLSDLLKQETGKTAIDLIHISLISEAKNLLREGQQGVAEVAYQLGFENSSYFTRLFKKQTGLKPLEFKKMHLN